ncbi:MAG: protein kinase [Chloroflexi bacterium]|nr:protein kinase [Chloroflexota bacterium]
MAEVYLGTHLTLDLPVAVKVLHSYIEAEPDLLARFQREAKVVAGLRHPNIVQIFDFDTYEGHPYIVMEYLKGPSLSTYLRKLHGEGRKLPFDRIGRLLRSLAAGIDYAHAQGVIHRDIKPANIILHGKSEESSGDSQFTKDVEPIITDFGLVRIARSASHTASGLVSGTPAYMSPEQARGDKVDHRTDIYSLGIVLYELLAGRVPFEADSTMAVIFKHINEPPPPIENIPNPLQTVIQRTLAKNPNDRYQNCRELVIEFHEAVGLRTKAESIHTAQSWTPKPAEASSKRNQPQRSVWIGAWIFACACLGALLLGSLGVSAISYFPQLRGIQTIFPSAESPGEEIIPDTGEGASPAGILRFQNGAAAMDQITISATLATPPERTQYEAWLIDDDHETSRSLGVLEQNDTGKFNLTVVDPQGRNLLGTFNRMEITLEPNPDDSPNSSRNMVYSSAIPPGPLEHIRHLMVGTDETPDEIAVGMGLINNVSLIKDSADAMLDAFYAGDRATMQSNAEAIVNLIVGREDLSYYNDWDGNGIIQDPGDGYGLLINGGQAGYLDGMIHHASYSAKASGATSEIMVHAEHVEICIQNLENWAPELRDLALRIARASQDQDVGNDLLKASILANQMLDGIDIDGSESVDPIAGEGGALIAFEHAEYMSDMPILPGENQVP